MTSLKLDVPLLSQKTDCLACQGTGKTNVSVTDENNQTDIVIIECFHCNGKGRVNYQERIIQEAEKQIWCECPADVVEQKGVQHHPDNSGKTYNGLECTKHHYSCNKCGLIVQIG